METIEVGKWVPLKRAQTAPDNHEQIRMSIAVSESCLRMIDSYRTENGLFNNRSDFIMAALRLFYFEFMEVADGEYEELKKKYPEYPARSIDELQKSIMDKIKAYHEAFMSNFGPTIDIQMPFYIPKHLRNCIYELQSISKVNAGLIVRAALMYLDLDLALRTGVRNQFVEDLNDSYRHLYGDD